MNPIGHGIFNGLRNKRVCPHCKREQIVSPDKKASAVTCKACGQSIPAPRKR